MKAPIVRIKIRVRLPDGSRPYLNPVTTANGKLKSGYAVGNGEPEPFPGGVYHPRYAKEDLSLALRSMWEAAFLFAVLSRQWEWKRVKYNDRPLRPERALTMSSFLGYVRWCAR